MVIIKYFLIFMTLAEKLKTARKSFGDTQAVAGKKSGVAQRDISYLEAGKKKYLPTEYILYLQKNGIDLNSLFDDSKELKNNENKNEDQVHHLEKRVEELEELVRLHKDAIELRDRKMNAMEKKFVGEIVGEI